MSQWSSLPQGSSLPPAASEATTAEAPLAHSPSDLYALPEEQMPEVERELVKRLRTGRAALPVLPHVAESALRLANDPDARIGQLAELVDTDPPIAARFLSVANSVAYWRGMVTASTQSAIVRLGLANTRDLLFQVVYAASSQGLKRFHAPVLASFRQSVISAVAARTAARELEIPTDYDYMIGLLHNIGEARVYRIIDAIPKAQEDLELVKALVHRYHCAAGAEIAMAWKLPTEIVDACAAHHDPAAMQSPHVRLAMIADCVVELLSASGEPDFTPLEALGIEVGVARRIVEKTKKSADLGTGRPSRP